MSDSQSLFDALAGAGGANINRPQLNAYIANSQAVNGLRSAQTEDALLKAQEMTEQSSARDQLESSIAPLFPGEPSKAHAATMMILAGAGDAKTAIQALNEVLKNQNTTTLSDPNQLGTPAQTAAMQGITGKLAPLQNVPNNYAVAPGAPQPNVQQSPQGAAQTALTQQQATNPQLFHPGGANAANAPLDPNMVNFGGYMLYKTGKMPAMGMGGGPARAAIISQAATLAQQEQAQPGSTTNPAFDQAINNGQDFTAAQRNLNSQAGGPLGNTTRSINNGVGHLQLMRNIFMSLQNNDTQTYNSLKNIWAKQFGSPAPTNVQAAAEVMGPELMKILTNNNGAGTVDERQGFSNTVGNLANAPEQTIGAIDTLSGMFGRQAADMALQYHGATQRNDFASRYLQPDVAKYLNLDPQSAQQTNGPGVVPTAPNPNAAPSAPVKIQNDDDYNKLPSGALFIGPDGNTRKKP